MPDSPPQGGEGGTGHPLRRSRHQSSPVRRIQMSDGLQTRGSDRTRSGT